MPTAVKRIPLDRRVCIVREGRIDIRPERGALVWPLIALLLSVSLFVAVGLFGNQLSALALAAMLIPGLLLGPFSAMALVYSLVGSYVIIDAGKQSVTFQQGMLGLGLGTADLVPFWKIERLEVRDSPLTEGKRMGPPPLLDMRAWDVILVKTSGKVLSIGQVVSANSPDLIDEAFDRGLDVAEAVGALVDKPVVIAAEVEERTEEPDLSESQGTAAEPDERAAQRAERSQRA